MFSWTRNIYAKMNGLCFQFESKRTRDRFVTNGAEKISAVEAYNEFSWEQRIKIEDRRVPIGRSHGKA